MPERPSQPADEVRPGDIPGVTVASGVDAPHASAPAGAQVHRRADGGARRHRHGLPQRFGRNVIMNYVAVASASVTSVLVTPILVRELGDVGYGVWALVGSLVGYLELFEFGFGAATSKLVAEDAGRRPERVSRTLSTSFFALSLFGLLAVVVGVVVAFNAPGWFDVSGGLASATTAAILFMTVALAISIPADTFGGVLGAYQRYDLRSLSNTANTLLTALASVAIVARGGGIVLLAAVSGAISMLMHPLRWAMVRHVDGSIRLSRRLVDRTRLRDVTSISGWMFLGKMSSLVSYRVDAIVVGAILGVRAVAVFVIGMKLARLAEKALTQMSNVFLPHASAAAADGDEPLVRQLMIDGTRVTMLIAVPVAVVMGLLADRVVEAWVGPRFEQAANILVIFSIYTVVRALVDTAESVAIGTGAVRPWALGTAAESVVNLAASVVLAHLIGIEGVALGTLASTVLVMVPVFLRITTTRWGLTTTTLLRRAALPHVPPAAATAVVLVVAGWAWRGAGLLDVVGLGGLGFLTYFGVYFVAGATEHERDVARRLARLGR